MNPIRPGEIVWIEGKAPARVLTVDAERRLVDVALLGRCRCGAGYWRPLTVAVCMLAREQEREGRTG